MDRRSGCRGSPMRFFQRLSLAMTYRVIFLKGLL
jgi:hypothetical protein